MQGTQQTRGEESLASQIIATPRLKMYEIMLVLRANMSCKLFLSLCFYLRSLMVQMLMNLKTIRRSATRKLERLKQIKENQNIGILSIINLPCTKDLHSQ